MMNKMFFHMLNYITSLPRGTKFTYRCICIKCFGRPYKCQYLALELEKTAYKNQGYIVIGCISSGANLYKRV